MSATGLTETQWMVLSAASQRDDHCAMLEAAQKVVKKLIDLGLVEAVRARGDLPVWRREDDSCPKTPKKTICPSAIHDRMVYFTSGVRRPRGRLLVRGT